MKLLMAAVHFLNYEPFTLQKIIAMTSHLRRLLCASFLFVFLNIPSAYSTAY